MLSVARPVAAVRLHLTGFAYHWQALAVIVIGSFMVILNMTVLNVALPRIIQIFQSTVDQGQLILTGYMLAIAVVMPATGYAVDTFGPKRTYLTSIGLFTLGSALCGLAPSMEVLVAFRVLQGLGGGMIMPLGMTMLFQVAPVHQRGAVMGIYGVPLLFAPMLGPIIGGYIVDYVGWRLIFVLAIPIGVLAVLAATAVLRETPPKGGLHFDWAGFLLAVVGCSAILLALARAPRDGWLAPHLVALWLVVALTIPSFIVVELTQAQPLLDLTVLVNRTYRIALMASFVVQMVFFTVFFLLPLFLQGVRGLTPLDTGLLMFPQGLGAAITMPLAGRLFDRLGPRPLIIPGLLGVATSTWLLSSLDPNTPDSSIRLTLLLRGVAMGFTFMPLTTVGLDGIPRPQMPRATVLNNVVRQIAASLGTAVFASFLIERQSFHQAILAQTVTPESIPVVQTLATLRTNLLQQGLAQASADLVGLSTLARQVNLEASIQAYRDCFFLATVITALALVPMLFIKRSRRA